MQSKTPIEYLFGYCSRRNEDWECKKESLDLDKWHVKSVSGPSNCPSSVNSQTAAFKLAKKVRIKQKQS